MRQTIIFLAAFALLALASCREETAVPTDLAADYSHFPLELNQPVYYALDSIVLFNTIQGVVYDTSRVEVRETLVEVSLAPDGREVYRGERWQRTAPNLPWTFVQTYSVYRTATNAVRQEDNLVFTKLVFPLRQDQRWDGHAAFDASRDIVVGGEFLDVFNGWDYRYAEVGQPVTLSTGATFAETVLVTQAETDNLIDLRFAYERYAPGIGLIERVIDARHTQCRVCCGGDTAACIDLPWDQKAEKGFILRQTFLRRD